MDSFGDGDRHPTRANPQTFKLVSSDVSFAKSLGRVLVGRGETNSSAAARVAELLPFLPDHYRRLRPDVDTARHLRKELTDAIATTRRTMERYRAPYPDPRLSPRKQAEVRLAVRVLDEGLQLCEGDAARLLGPLKDDR